MKIVNFTADGGWGQLQIPLDWGSFKVQARTAADIQVRVVGATDFWTIKSGSSQEFDGGLTNSIEFKAANGVVIEMLLGFSARQSI